MSSLPSSGRLLALDWGEVRIGLALSDETQTLATPTATLVRRAGKRIELTAKEYSLLEYFATHPGRVFSRTMIIEHVWDQSFEGLTNIVDVYVRHLRGKVDDPFPTKLLRTVRGMGYCLSDEGET